MEKQVSKLLESNEAQMKSLSLLLERLGKLDGKTNKIEDYIPPANWTAKNLGKLTEEDSESKGLVIKDKDDDDDCLIVVAPNWMNKK